MSFNVNSSMAAAAAPKRKRGRSKDNGRRGSEMDLARRLAVFGESHLALVASLIMLLIAILVSLSLDNTTAHPSSPPKIYAFRGHVSSFVTDEVLKEYKQDGVIAVRGLLDRIMLNRIDKASRKVVQQHKSRRHGAGTQFFQVQVGLAFSNEFFREVALSSRISQIAAHLLELEGNSTMRMMRDIFLVKDDDPYICGWHVDDTGFWPAIGDAPGVNAWIALDDMPLKGGGGFALAVGSHRGSEEAHVVTGSTKTLPANGFKDVADLFANRTGEGTCNLKTAAPHLNRRMEDSKRIYEMKRGDVIFHDRWLFHRTVPFDRHFLHELKDDPLYRRYSVRYGPGTSTIPPGYGLELSVLWNPENGGKPADQVCQQDGPWYPQTWPEVNEKEMEQLPSLLSDKIPVAEAARKARQKEMKPYLEEMRQKQKRNA